MPTVTLYVDAFDSTNAAWTEQGTPPYLQDTDTDYVYTATRLLAQGWFAFAASPGAGTINSVLLYVETQQDAGGDDKITFSMQATGVAEFDAGTIIPNAGAYTWQNINISASINTWAKIDSVALQLNSVRTGGTMSTVYCRRAYLYVDYNPPTLTASETEAILFMDALLYTSIRTMPVSNVSALFDSLSTMLGPQNYTKTPINIAILMDALAMASVKTYEKTINDVAILMDTLRMTSIQSRVEQEVAVAVIIDALAVALSSIRSLEKQDIANFIDVLTVTLIIGENVGESGYTSFIVLTKKTAETNVTTTPNGYRGPFFK